MLPNIYINNFGIDTEYAIVSIKCIKTIMNTNNLNTKNYEKNTCKINQSYYYG